MMRVAILWIIIALGIGWYWKHRKLSFVWGLLLSLLLTPLVGFVIGLFLGAKIKWKEISWETLVSKAFVIGALLIGIIWYGKFRSWLRYPLPIDYGMTWVVLTLISMLTLGYVEMINRLKDINRKKQNIKPGSEPKIYWTIDFLSCTVLILLVTFLGLVCRVVYLSFCQNAADIVRELAKYGTLRHELIVEHIDYVIIYSFIVSSIMRFLIFLQSYLEDIKRFFRYPVF